MICQGELTENNVLDADFQDYLNKICADTPTCNITNTVPPLFRSLKVRNCMCDDQCALYDDCCSDTPSSSNQSIMNISPDEFRCMKTYENDFVYMITKCPESWNQSIAIKDNCETNDEDLLRVDVLLSTYVTDVNGRTYKNMFCALCHRQNNFSFWDLFLTYEAEKSSSNTTKATPSIPDHSTLQPANIDHILTLLEYKDFFWHFFYNDTRYNVYFNAVKYQHSNDSSVRYCVPQVVTTCSATTSSCSNHTSYVHTKDKVFKNRQCLECNNASSTDIICNNGSVRTGRVDRNFVIKIMDERVKKVDGRCGEMPDTIFAHGLFCFRPRNRTKPESKLSACFPRRKDTGKPCLLNRIYLKTEVQFRDNDTSIYVNELETIYHSEEFGANESHVYVCGTYVHDTEVQRLIEILDEIITSVLIKISMLCLLLQLFTFQQLPEMKNLSGKNLASFCATLLLAFLCFDIGPWLPSCRVTAIIAHYAFLSCFTWMLVMSYDCWLSLYRATAQFRTSGGKHATKFFIYCLICWIAPLIFMAIPLYIEFSDSVECTLKAGYGLTKECFIFGKSAQYVFFFLPASVMFLGNIIFFALTAHMIYYTQKKTVNPNTRNDFRLYTRLALLMGLTWTLGSLAQLTNSAIIGLLFSVMNMSQGMFIFFGFTFKKKTIRSLLEKHKDNRLVTNTLSTFVSTMVSPSSERKTQIESSS